MDIETVLTRGVSEILPSKKGLAEAMAKGKITLYQGFDPSSPSLHLGNMIGLRKLAQFQALGHKVIFLIGDFTGMIGDPTDKAAARKKLTDKEVLQNLKEYKNQASKILKFSGKNAAEVKFNSQWLSKLPIEEFLSVASHFTTSQLLERDMFQERLKAGKSVFVHEFLYPILQGYDSVAMNVDLEIGGNDQLFNMLAGRTLVKAFKGKEKYVLTIKLLTDPTGKKMGKTEGNVINLSDEPIDIFGKIMALPDTLTLDAVELLTDLSSLPKNPFEAKKKLAFNVIKQLHGETAAKSASTFFEKTFQKGKTPKNVKTVSIKEHSLPLLDLVFATKEVPSRSEAKRLILQGGIDVAEKTIDDPTQEIAISQKGIIEPVRFENGFHCLLKFAQNNEQFLLFFTRRVCKIKRVFSFTPNDTSPKISLIFVDVNQPMRVFFNEIFFEICH
ncbi:tyrosine--tRNA ligase [Candidatus Woesebacteria bacterium]|nr:tyrosine--tRNA ligase [Candidatus Woesebacteria bacterium]